MPVKTAVEIKVAILASQQKHRNIIQCYGREIHPLLVLMRERALGLRFKSRAALLLANWQIRQCLLTQETCVQT